MGFATISLCILLMTTTNSRVDSQFDYGYRNWYGGASPFDRVCRPDGSDCLRMTECCSTSCSWRSNGPKCEPSPCGCPQPPWTNEPIDRDCHPYTGGCNHNYHCCSGFCRLELYKCAMPPCKPCS